MSEWLGNIGIRFILLRKFSRIASYLWAVCSILQCTYLSSLSSSSLSDMYSLSRRTSWRLWPTRGSI